jgi:hypothetical protein
MSDAGQSDVLVSHEESLRHPVVDAARKAVREALEDHKRAGNPIAGWRDGRVVLIPPEEIEV